MRKLVSYCRKLEAGWRVAGHPSRDLVCTYVSFIFQPENQTNLLSLTYEICSVVETKDFKISGSDRTRYFRGTTGVQQTEDSTVVVR